MSDSSAECREQQSIDLELRGLFQDVERPLLSERFQLTLHERIAVERRLRTQGRFSIMHAYWLAAGIASALILLNINLPGLAGSGSMVVAVIIPVLCFVAPIVLLGLHLRTGLLDLIFSTMTIPDKRLQ
jgi:hypothetical protein